MKKTILGIILFLFQIFLAFYFNNTIDLKIIIVVSLITFGYIIYKHFLVKKYQQEGK
jgi:hypothetical protein